MAPELARLRRDQQSIERTLERNQAILNTVRQKSGRYSRTLITSGAEIESARSDLRKVGYLKK
jgi:hypothetical protein